MLPVYFLSFSFSICEIACTITKQIFLIPLDRKMIMGLSFLNQVICQTLLRQQGIGGDCFSFDFDAVE